MKKLSRAGSLLQESAWFCWSSQGDKESQQSRLKKRCSSTFFRAQNPPHQPLSPPTSPMLSPSHLPAI